MFTAVLTTNYVYARLSVSLFSFRFVFFARSIHASVGQINRVEQASFDLSLRNGWWDFSFEARELLLCLDAIYNCCCRSVGRLDACLVDWPVFYGDIVVRTRLRPHLHEYFSIVQCRVYVTNCISLRSSVLPGHVQVSWPSSRSIARESSLDTERDASISSHHPRRFHVIHSSITMPTLIIFESIPSHYGKQIASKSKRIQ